jgi:type IV secretory pathway VirB4 component
MNTQKIQSQIDKKEAELKVLREKLKAEQDKTEWLYIPELKIEIQTKIHHKGKSYDDLVKELGKEYLESHLPTYSQLQFLRNLAVKENKYTELGLIDTWEFVKQEDEISKKNGYVARFCVGWGVAYLVCDWFSCNSGSFLGVRFVRQISGKK